jgi:DNA mismatch endonuclease, patch repair protein
MTDCFEPEVRSRVMARIRSQGNYTTELRFIKLMRQYGISGWRRRSKLLGRPDFVFARAKVAVFIDGDFWHGNPKKFRLPKTNSHYWEQKIDGNRKRDRTVNKVLKQEGWRVVRIWESSLNDGEAIIARLQILL